MAEQHQYGTVETNQGEQKDRGLFSCFGKKEEKPNEQEDVAMSEAEHQKKGHSTLVEKLHRSHSSSSSSSEEEVEEGGMRVRRRKKKGLKDKAKDKDTEGMTMHQENVAPDHFEHHQAKENPEAAGDHQSPPEAKKGIFEMIKEKIPGVGGGNNKEAEAVPPGNNPHNGKGDGHCFGEEGEGKEKKGLMEKIKEKLPGGGHKDGEEVKKDD